MGLRSRIYPTSLHSAGIDARAEKRNSRPRFVAFFSQLGM
jgi:hypothetical protein